MKSVPGETLEVELERRFVTATTELSLGTHAVSLLRPKDYDDLISEEDFVRDDRLPYWADLWPSSTILAGRLLSEPGAGRTLLELGCGLGLVTVAAQLAGFAVTATDYYEDALRFTRLNSRRATGREPSTRLVDWRDLPADLGRFDYVVAADVLYERPYGALVAATVARTLRRGGSALIADPGRIAAESFLEECARLGLRLASMDDEPWEEGTARQRIRVYRLRFRG